MTERILFLIMIFILVVVISQAIGSLLTGATGRTRRLLRKRLRNVAGAGQLSQLSLSRRQYLLSLQPWERQLEIHPAFESLRDTMDQAGLELPAYRIALLMLLTTILGFGITALFVREGLLLMMLGGLLGLLLPLIWLTVRRIKRMRQFERELPDGINLISRSLRAGLPFSQSLAIASEEVRGPVGREFGLIFSEINYGGDVREALLRFLERMPIVPVMALVSSIMIQRESGGNLAELLDRIEALLRQRFRFQRKVKTLTASNRMSAWVVSIMPFALSAILEFMSPGWVTILFETPIGRQMVAVAIIMQILGILWIRKMTRIEI